MGWRERSYIGLSDEWTKTGPGLLESDTSYVTLDQTTWSDNHDVKRLGEGDQGGPFHTTRKYFRESSTGPYEIRGLLFGHSGRVWPSCNPCSGSWPAYDVEHYAPDLIELGTRAIADTIPTNPSTSLATFLGELRNDGIPKMIGAGLLKSKLRDFRELGSEYLNYQFGWSPFVGDLQKFAHDIKNSNRILEQYHRDADRKVRRRRDFPIETSTEVNSIPFAYQGSSYGPLNAWFDYGIEDPKVTVFKKRKRWFSACYVYSVPPAGDLGGLARFEADANRLLGTRITPEVLWNLAPWSWAADWFGNVGDIMHNVSAFATDGVVLQYGYIMEERIHEVTYSQKSVLRTQSGETITPELSVTFGAISKYRLPASPFGFGLTIEMLTPRQLAIMGALGLSKSPKRLDPLYWF